MKDNLQQDRPVLSVMNSEKLAKISFELNLSKSEILNRILDALTSVELYQIVKFGINTSDGVKPKKIIIKRNNFLTKF